MMIWKAGLSFSEEDLTDVIVKMINIGDNIGMTFVSNLAIQQTRVYVSGYCICHVFDSYQVLNLQPQTEYSCNGMTRNVFMKGGMFLKTQN